MAKGMKGGAKGPRMGPGYKFLNPNNFPQSIKNGAYAEYVSNWEETQKFAKALEVALTEQWNLENPNGKDGKFMSIKVEDGAAKYVMKAKRAAQQSALGDDVFGNPQ
jgi:hypothetical protein